MLHFPEGPSQKKLYGASKLRAEAVLRVAEEKINLKTLVTEENLKRVRILFDKVRTKCKLIKFRKGVPVPSDSENESDENHEEMEETSKGNPLQGAPLNKPLIEFYLFL